MIPTGSSVSTFSPANLQHQWATFAALSGQPGLNNGQPVPIDRLMPGIMDSSNMLLGQLAPAYVRSTHSAHPSPSVIPGSGVPHAGPTPFNQHHTLGYHFHNSLDPSVATRQFATPALAPSIPYPLNQPFQPTGSTQPLSLSHAPNLYGQSPYFSSSLMPTLCNGAINPVPQCATVPGQPPTVLVAAAMAGVNPVRNFDSLKHFGALPPNRRNKLMITSKTNLYISGLSESDTDETVRLLVANVVQPKSCKAIVHNGRCKGSGFIDCATEEDAEKAKNHIVESSKTSDRKLSVKYAFENEKDVLNVYVRNLPRSGFSKGHLERLFLTYGHVTSVKLLETESGPTGIGFVRYATAEQAEKAVETVNKAEICLPGVDKPITCKLADKAEPRRRTSTSGTTLLPYSQLPLTSHFQRQTLGLNSSGLVHPSGLHQSPTQQTASYAQQIPVAGQLFPPLQQTQVAVPTPNASPHSRGILTHAVLPNGATGIPNVPLSTMSSVLPCGLTSQINMVSTAATPRAPPLMPSVLTHAQQVSVVAGAASSVPISQQPPQQQQPNAINFVSLSYATASHSADSNVASGSTGTPKHPNATYVTGPPNGAMNNQHSTIVNSNNNTNAFHAMSGSINNSQSLNHLVPAVPSNFPYGTGYVQQPMQTTGDLNAINPQLFVLTTPPATGVYHPPIVTASISSTSSSQPLSTQSASQQQLPITTQTQQYGLVTGVTDHCRIYPSQQLYPTQVSSHTIPNFCVAGYHPPADGNLVPTSMSMAVSEMQLMNLNYSVQLGDNNSTMETNIEAGEASHDSPSWEVYPVMPTTEEIKTESEDTSESALYSTPSDLYSENILPVCDDSSQKTMSNSSKLSPVQSLVTTQPLGVECSGVDSPPRTVGSPTHFCRVSTPRTSSTGATGSVTSVEQSLNGSASSELLAESGSRKISSRVSSKKHNSPASGPRGRRRSESGINDGRLTPSRRKKNISCTPADIPRSTTVSDVDVRGELQTYVVSKHPPLTEDPPLAHYRILHHSS